MSILGGIGWHMVGAASAASFYAPIEKVKKWSWETTWAVAGIFSWVLLPLIVSLILLPDFHGFYAAIPAAVLIRTFLFGGIVGLALGEWRGASGRPVQLLWSGMVIIIAAANLVGLGMAY